jgi:hypothetical protein
MKLIAEITAGLAAIAGRLFERTGKEATIAVHDCLEKLALDHANDQGFAFGSHLRVDPKSLHPDAELWLRVFRDHEGHKLYEGSLRALSFDHSWLLLYRQGESEGYLADVVLAAESELFPDQAQRGLGYVFFRDFWKVATTRARHKLMIFRSTTQKNADDTFGQLEHQIQVSKMAPTGCTYLLSGWCAGHFQHNVIQEGRD